MTKWSKFLIGSLFVVLIVFAVFILVLWGRVNSLQAANYAAMRQMPQNVASNASGPAKQEVQPVISQKLPIKGEIVTMPGDIDYILNFSSSGAAIASSFVFYVRDKNRLAKKYTAPLGYGNHIQLAEGNYDLCVEVMHEGRLQLSNWVCFGVYEYSREFSSEIGFPAHNHPALIPN